jgi:hypothetical protein
MPTNEFAIGQSLLLQNLLYSEINLRNVVVGVKYKSHVLNDTYISEVSDSLK